MPRSTSYTLAKTGDPFPGRALWPERPGKLPLLATWKAACRELRYAGNAGILPALDRHGGSNRQGKLLKPRHFAETGYRIRYADPMRARRSQSQGGGLPKRLRFAESYPAILPRGLENRIIIFAAVCRLARQAVGDQPLSGMARYGPSVCLPAAVRAFT